MQAPQLILFAESQPFEPFRVFVADGRRIDVRHPEMTLVGLYAMSHWVFYRNGEVEVIDADQITALKTLGPVDPEAFAGSQIEQEE